MHPRSLAPLLAGDVLGSPVRVPLGSGVLVGVPGAGWRPQKAGGGDGRHSRPSRPPGTAPWQDRTRQRRVLMGISVPPRRVPTRLVPPARTRFLTRNSRNLHGSCRLGAEAPGMPNLTLVAWEIRRTSTGRVPGRTCPRCRRTGTWSAVRERRRLRLLGLAVGGVSRRDLVACHSCGCALPADWREAQSDPSPTPVPA